MRVTGQLRLGSVLSCVMLLSGCIAEIPDDLTFVSVEAVDWHGEQELPGHGAEKQHRLMLKATFTSSVDLVRFVEKRSYSLGAGAFFCDDPEQGGNLAYPAIYWQSLRIDRYEGDVTALRRNSERDAISYYAYLDTEQLQRPWHLAPGRQNVYDLRTDPKDICLYVSGGSMSGFGYKSNSVIIPTSAIVAALRDLPPVFQ